VLVLLSVESVEVSPHPGIQHVAKTASPNDDIAVTFFHEPVGMEFMSSLRRCPDDESRDRYSKQPGVFAFTRQPAATVSRLRSRCTASRPAGRQVLPPNATVVAARQSAELTG
jgi:hypothetical protein